jgi:hypothetical protein
MKTIISLIAVAGVLFVAGCSQNSDNTTDNTSATNSVESEMKTNANTLAGEMKTNVVSPITNAYMSTTNSILTNR